MCFGVRPAFPASPRSCSCCSRHRCSGAAGEVGDAHRVAGPPVPAVILLDLDEELHLYARMLRVELRFELRAEPAFALEAELDAGADQLDRHASSSLSGIGSNDSTSPY